MPWAFLSRVDTEKLKGMNLRENRQKGEVRDGIKEMIRNEKEKKLEER